jgi:hypothetical protein
LGERGPGFQGSRIQGFEGLFSRQISIARTNGIMHPVMLGHMGTGIPFAVISTLNISLNRCPVEMSIKSIAVIVVAGFISSPSRF